MENETDMENESTRIADQLSRTYDGDPWHGLPLTRILEGITAEEAFAHPVPGANSICEIVLHMAAWIEETRRRIHGDAPGEPAGGEWPVVRGERPAEWESAKGRLARAVEALAQRLQTFPEERLVDRVGASARDRAAGTGISYYVLLHGIVQHTVYHSAQIATLKRSV